MRGWQRQAMPKGRFRVGRTFSPRRNGKTRLGNVYAPTREPANPVGFASLHAANVFHIELEASRRGAKAFPNEAERARRATTRPPNPLNGSRFPRTRSTFSQSPKGHLDHESQTGKAFGGSRGCNFSCWKSGWHLLKVGKVVGTF